METPFVPVLLSLLVVGIITLGWRTLDWVWLKPKRLERQLRKQGFKGNPYRFLVGDTKDFARMLKQAKTTPIDFDADFVTRVNPFVYQTVKNYGKDSFFWFGPTPRVLIMDPDHIREILNKIDDFPKLINSPLARYLASGLVILKGHKWAKHRKIMNPAFRAEKLKLMIPAIYQSCSDMISKWEGLVPGEGKVELDVWPDVQTLSSDSLSRTAFGSSYEEGRKIFELLKQLAILTVQVQQSVYIPGSRFLPSMVQRRMRAINKEVKESIKAIIKKREKLHKAGETVGEDLLGMLMQSNRKEMEEGNGEDIVMSTEDMIGECKLFYFAGNETTSSLILWTMILLSKHSDWQERAREEVLQVFGRNCPNYDGLNHLKVVTMILHEVLRLYPPIIGLPRRVSEDMKLGNLTLPAKVQVFIPVILVQHDKGLWGKDALDFKPERFSEGVSKATNNQVSFFPFGWRPRICIGQNFALIEAKIAIVKILQRFSFELSPSYSHAPHTVVTLQPQYGAHLILHTV